MAYLAEISWQRRKRSSKQPLTLNLHANEPFGGIQGQFSFPDLGKGSSLEWSPSLLTRKVFAQCLPCGSCTQNLDPLGLTHPSLAAPILSMRPEQLLQNPGLACSFSPLLILPGPGPCCLTQVSPVPVQFSTEVFTFLLPHTSEYFSLIFPFIISVCCLQRSFLGANFPLFLGPSNYLF